ncbi:MAG: proprotein convertase P-domain-containing protein, partial [Gammaproteobacteria bacterium]
LSEVMRIHGRLVQTSGDEKRAAELLAEFWDRRADNLANSGDRDGALLSVLQAMELPTEERRRHVAELIGPDYKHLQGTIRSDSGIDYVAANEETGVLTVLDRRNFIQVWDLSEGVLQRLQSFSLVAEERIALQRRLTVGGDVAGRRLVMDLATDHPRPQQLMIVLRAPSGRQVELRPGRQSSTGKRGEYVFTSRAFAPLRELLGDDVTGTWTAAFSDTQQGVTGRLLKWDLKIDGVSAESVAELPAEAETIPEPRPSIRVRSVLGSDGRQALVWPAEELAGGELLVWDVPSETVTQRIPRSDDFLNAFFVRDGRSVMTVGPRQLKIWDVGTAKLQGTIQLTAPLRDAPIMSANRQYLVVDVIDNAGDHSLAIWDLNRMRRIRQLDTGDRTGPIVIDQKGLYLAVGDNDRLVRVWSLADGGLYREFDQGAPATNLEFDVAGRWLVSQDVTRTLRLWDLKSDATPVIERAGNTTWRTAFSATGNELLLGSSGRAYELVDLRSGVSQNFRLRHPGAATQAADTLPPVLMAERKLAITHDLNNGLKVWDLPVVPRAGGESPAALTAAPFRAVASPRGEYIALGTHEGDVRVLPVVNDQALFIKENDGPRFIGHPSAVSVMRFFSDSSVIASGSMDGSVRVWETETGVPNEFYTRHLDGGVHDLMFSASGLLLVSVSSQEVIVTDNRTGEVVARLAIQARHPRIAVAGEADQIYVAGDRGGVTRWDWRAAKVDEIIPAEYQVRRIAVNASGTRLVAAGAARNITAWSLPDGVLLERSVQAAGSVDEVWINEAGKVTVLAGNWLQSMSLFQVGLNLHSSWLLPGDYNCLEAAADGFSALVVSHLGSTKPAVQRLQIDSPQASPVDGEAEQLRDVWQTRLALVVDDLGEFTPL